MKNFLPNTPIWWVRQTLGHSYILLCSKMLKQAACKDTFKKIKKNKITDSKNSEKEKVVMQTLARNENKNTCWCDLNSCYRCDTNFIQNFSAINVERFLVSMFNYTIPKVNGKRIVNKKAVETKILQYKQFIVKADTMFCARLSSFLAWSRL